ncbi:hypothetical protein EDC04DRAFT_2896829 [Pisolithus marmoratus]|nr:hypothetical protein EDC04DRAFT_2896829 [Pisolithus marmoratus]
MFSGVDEAEFCAWLEELAVNQKKGSNGHPKEYKKGPDVGSKAEHMKQCYKKLLENQTSLTNFRFTSSAALQPRTDKNLPPAAKMDVPLVAPTVCTDDEVIPVSPASPTNQLPLCREPESPHGTLASDSDMDVQVTHNHEAPNTLESGPDNIGLSVEADGFVEDAEEAWEDELEEQERGGIKIRGWHELCNQIKSNLAKGAKTLPLSCINQLMLIWSFATLHLKGLGHVEVRALACHYQVFEQLPTEKHGGQANALSPLKDEQLQLATHQWLLSEEVGQLTPHQFCHALNEIIIPSLGITLARPLCEQTA